MRSTFNEFLLACTLSAPPALAQSGRPPVPPLEARPSASSAMDEAYRLKTARSYAEAAHAFERARGLGADPQRVSLELAYLHAEEGDSSAARAAFEAAARGTNVELAAQARAELQAMAVQPAVLPNAGALGAMNEAYALRAEGRPREARAAFERARTLGGDPQRISMELGYLAVAGGDVGEAKTDFAMAAGGPDATLAAQARGELANLPHTWSGDLYVDAYGWDRIDGASHTSSLVPSIRLRGFVRPLAGVDLSFYLYAQATRDTASVGSGAGGLPVILADDYALFGAGVRLRVLGGHLNLFAQIGPAIDLLDDGRRRFDWDARVGLDLYAETSRCAPKVGRPAYASFIPCAEIYGEGVYVSRYDNNFIGFVRPRVAATYLVTGPVAWQALLEARVAKDVNDDYYNNFVDGGGGLRFRLLAPARVDLLLTANAGTYFGLSSADPAPSPLHYGDLRLEATTYLEF